MIGASTPGMRTLKLFALTLLTPACMLSPLWGDTIPSRNSSVSFSFYATAANTPITVDCSPEYIHPVWTQIFTFQSGSSPWTYNGETVYASPTSRVIPGHCWKFWHGKWRTQLRPRQNGSGMMVYDQAGVTCISDRFSEGKGPVTAGYECGLTYSNSSNKLPYVSISANN